MKKNTSKTYHADDDEFFTLFYTGERDHICDLIKESFDPVSNGYRASLAESLNRLLLQPVKRLILRLHETGRGTNAVEFEPADKFRESIEYVSQALAMSDDGTNCPPYTKADTEELSDILCDSWTKFIADAGAHRMYHDLPRELAKEKATSKTNSENSGKLRKKEVTKDALEAFQTKFIEDYYRDNGKRSNRGWKKAACIEFNVTTKTLNDRMRE